MKVLFFIESLRAGGKERRVIELVKGLIKTHNNLEIFLVLTRKEIHYQEVHSLGIPIYFIERRYLKKDPRLFFKFFSLVKKIKPDVIHVWGHMVAVYSIPAKLILNIPLINNEITDSTPNQNLLGKSIVFRYSDRIISNTRIGLSAYEAPLSKSSVIYNGFNFNRISNLRDVDEVRQQFNITTRHIVAMVASFLNYKDYTTYLAAAQAIVKVRNDVTFLCIGEGDDSYYRTSIPEQFNSRILFLGRQDHVESIMNICDVGVLTTDIRYHGEGISNALMEFMALRKPVITTDYGGSVELVEQSVTGYLIKAFDINELVEKINLLISNEKIAKEMGQRALQRVQEKFSIESMVDNFYKEYTNLLSGTSNE